MFCKELDYIAFKQGTHRIYEIIIIGNIVYLHYMDKEAWIYKVMPQTVLHRIGQSILSDWIV